MVSERMRAITLVGTKTRNSRIMYQLIDVRKGRANTQSNIPFPVDMRSGLESVIGRSGLKHHMQNLALGAILTLPLKWGILN